MSEVIQIRLRKRGDNLLEGPPLVISFAVDPPEPPELRRAREDVMARVRAAVAPRACYHWSAHVSTPAVLVTYPIPVPIPSWFVGSPFAQLAVTTHSGRPDRLIVTWRCAIFAQTPAPSTLEIPIEQIVGRHLG